MNEQLLMKIVAGGIIAVMSTPFIYKGLEVGLEVAGYYPCHSNCLEMSEIFTSKNIPSTECRKIINLDIFPGPTLNDIRATCLDRMTSNK